MPEWRWRYYVPATPGQLFTREPVPSNIAPTTESSPEAQVQPVKTLTFRDLFQAEAARLGIKQAIKEVEPPKGPKFRWCVTMDMAQTGPCQSIYAFNDRLLNWMIRHVAEGDLSAAAKTVAYKVTQNPDSKFPLTMLTQTRLWSPSFGEQPLYHNHSCVDAEDEGQEVVVAHIQLGFYMPMNISFYWSSSIRPLTLHADERPAREARKLPIHGEEEDLEDAREILSWGVTQCEATAAFGGIVPIVKDGMRDMARQAIEAYGGMAHLGIQESSKWRDYQCEFEEAVRPLDEEMVVRALANAMAQVREACRQYELTKGGKVADRRKRT